MVLELHTWGPAFGLASIDAECIATIAYCQRVIPEGEWTLVADHDASIGFAESLPVLFDDGVATATGFEDIVAYLRNHPAVANDIDARLTTRQQTDRTAFITFLQSTATPLLDLLLYVSAENYNETTSAAYTAILPWYANYTVPPQRRELARMRTAHMGLSSLDVDTTAGDGYAPGRGTASAEFEAAKRAAGLQTDGKPSTLSMGRGRGIGGFLGAPIHAARIRLDALSNELLEPLAELLGRNNYLLGGSQPSSLDCLAFGYLSLMYYPKLPHTWFKDTTETNHPRITTYIHRLGQELFSDEEVKAHDVWSISTNSTGMGFQERSEPKGMLLPWRPRLQPFSSHVLASTRELFGILPWISSLLKRDAVLPSGSLSTSKHARSALPSPLFLNILLGFTAAFSVGFAAFAIRHRRSPRSEELIFWSLRPTVGMGEAGNIFRVLNQLPSGGFAQL